MLTLRGNLRALWKAHSGRGRKRAVMNMGVLPDSWRKPAGAGVPFVIGPVVVYKKDKNGKTETQVMSSWADWLGLIVLILTIAAIWKGQDPVTVITALKGLGK